jgi:flagellar hook-associated protein 2
LQSRLTTIESRYRKQFATLDTLVTSMNGTSAYLTQQLANLPGAYRSNNN